jgi:hypothetical protein
MEVVAEGLRLALDWAASAADSFTAAVVEATTAME